MVGGSAWISAVPVVLGEGLTVILALVGTPEHTPPDQVQGDDVDAHSNLLCLPILGAKDHQVFNSAYNQIDVGVFQLRRVVREVSLCFSISISCASSHLALPRIPPN